MSETQQEALIELIRWNQLSPYETSIIIKYLDIRTKIEVMNILETEFKKDWFKRLQEEATK